MKFLPFASQALVALTLALDAQALPQKRAEVTKNPNSNSKSNKEGLERCQKFDDDREGSAKELWDKSRAGLIADDFINKHGVSNWVQELDKSLFDSTSDTFDCFGSGAQCQLKKDCSDYANVGKDGAYFLFYSLQTVRAVFKTMLNRFTEDTVLAALHISSITADFKRDDGDDKPQVETIVAASFGMLSGLLAVGPSLGVGAASLGVASAVSAVGSGLSTTLGQIKPKEVDDKEFEKRLEKRVSNTFQNARTTMEDTIGALFGVEGKDQKLIPKEMTKQAFDNAVVNALGDGQWIVNHSSDGALEKGIDNMFHQLKQALAWVAIRDSRRGFFFIDNGTPKKTCGDGKKDHPEEFWDDKAGGCVKLMEVTYKGAKKLAALDYVSKDIHKKLWANDGDYNLDVKKTYQNAYDCWVDNDGKVGKAVPNKDPGNKDLPKCWFGIPFVKGSKERDQVIKMDDFPGNKKGAEWNGKFKDNGLDYIS